MENIFNQEFVDNMVHTVISVLLKLLFAILIVIIGRIIIKWITKLLKNGRFAKKSDPTVVLVLQHFVSITLYVLLTVSVIAVLGVPMASIVAVIASAGVAIGLALQGALSNLAGGIMILMFRPFRIGDFIEVSNFSGNVTDIGIFYTILTTTDNKQVTIPNGSVMSATVVNYSVKDTRRVELVFNVAYGTDVTRVRNILMEEAGKHDLVLKTPEPFARLSKQSESSLDFTLRVWVKSDDFWQVKFDLLEAVNNRFVAEDIEVPFNQLDVHLKEEAKAKSEAQSKTEN